MNVMGPPLAGVMVSMQIAAEAATPRVGLGGVTCLYRGSRRAACVWTRILTVCLLWSARPSYAQHAHQIEPEPVEKWRKACEDGVNAGKYGEALPACQSAAHALENLSSRRKQLADVLAKLAVVYYSGGNYGQAESLFLRALRTNEHKAGAEDLQTASMLNDLAVLYDTQSQYAKAETLYRRSLQIRERLLFDHNHTDIGDSLFGLGVLYQHQGEYAKAEPLLQRSLRIYESIKGAEDPMVAAVQNSLALLHFAEGEYAKAEPLWRSSLHIREKTLGPGSVDVAETLSGLGTLYEMRKDFAKAELLQLRSLRIREQSLPKDHPILANSLHNLGSIYFAEKDYAKAEQYWLRGLALSEKTLTKDHIQIANATHALGCLYTALGQHDRARSYFVRSLGIRERTLGAQHPDVGMSQHNLAVLEVVSGHPDDAAVPFRRALAIREQALRSAATEARVTQLLDSLRGEEDTIYTLLTMPAVAARLLPTAMTTILLRKGRTAEASLMTGRALRGSLTTADQRRRFARWQGLRKERETMLLRGRGGESPDRYQDRLFSLQNQIDAGEQELARTAPVVAAWRLPSTEDMIRRVAARLPAGSALVELIWYRPFLFFSQGRENSFGEPRYLAILLTPDEQLDVVELGAAAQIDRAVGDFLVAARDRHSEPRLLAQALYSLVFAPLVPKLKGATRIFLSPDGTLDLTPFAAMHDGQRYLIDTPYQLIYLSSGRDLLRGPFGRPAAAPLVLADPDYAQPLATAPRRSPGEVPDDAAGLYAKIAQLPPLPGTRTEGDELGRLLGVNPLLGAAASEMSLRKARAPRLVHIATHGVFLDEQEQQLGRSALLKAATAPQQVLLDRVLGRSSDRSLSRSALALTHALHAAEATDTADDGLLTAEEASSLNLAGTYLVVLSACDTGRGSIKVGQGVYGLRRAFFVAGAETVVSSLWAVSDEGTQGLMQRYYHLLLDKKRPRGRVSGLAEAMRAVQETQPHPYYWAPFIAIGSDGPLPAARHLAQRGP